ncbi:hypothetical protein M569_07296 [Genlisea aurea]|uniref:Uncharacterized protein n=1 Tax=Genlisea aurea TaxID=192259 RepID=S8E556_9LAMI|nr:hypothetical protein M569_07296 [Genlisea aurea]
MPEGNDTQGLQRSSPCNTPMLFYRYHDGTQCSSLTACVHDNPEFKDPDVSRGRYRPTVQKDGNIIYWDVESWEDRHPGHGARDLKYGIRRPIP